MKLIGLSGKAQAGKSTTAKYLASHGYIISHFKTPLANMARALLYDLGISRYQIEEYLDGYLKSTPIPEWEHITARKIQQALGKDFRDAIDSEIWLKIWWNKFGHIERLVNEGVRFDFEATFIKSKGGIIVRLINPRTEVEDSHVSEQIDFPADVTIMNTGSIEELHEKINTMVFRKGLTLVSS